MVFESFAALVGFLALAYAGITKYLQATLVDRSEMEKIQAESKKLNEEFERAKKAGNKKRMEEIMKEQMEFLPRMNSVMMKQFRPMIYILAVFGLFTWGIGLLDPSVKDDILIPMTDDGNGCDKAADDGIFSACFEMGGENYGKWTAAAKAYEGNAEIARNETYFHYNAGPGEDTYSEHGTGEGLEISTDRKSYQEGETVTLTAVPANMTKGLSFIIPLSPPRETNVDRVELSLSNGTYFSVDLPLAIPLLNVKRIYQPYWWFIFVSLISSLCISFIMGRYEKMKKKSESGEKK
jgi:hypothetical protein